MSLGGWSSVALRSPEYRGDRPQRVVRGIAVGVLYRGRRAPVLQPDGATSYPHSQTGGSSPPGHIRNRSRPCFGASFDSTKTSLEDLLDDVARGDLQLPDFQRGWVWDDDRIRSLLASVSVSFPIGAIMTLQAGGDVQFQTRPIEGADSAGDQKPTILLLDGQQRLTSLFQALKTSTPVATQDSRGKAIKRHYYVNMELALREDVDRDEWIVSCAGGRNRPIIARSSARSFGFESGIRARLLSSQQDV